MAPATPSLPPTSALRLVFALAAVPAIGAVWALRRVHDTPPAPPRAAGRVPLTRPFVVLLVAVTLFGLANSSDTLLLLRASSVGFSAAGLAFVYAAFNLAYALLAIPAGILSDRIGRRPLLLIGWATYALVYLGFAYATKGWQIIGLFLAYGIYFASAEGTLKAWVASMVPPERRGAAYGLFAAASGLLILPASVLAGWLWDRYGPKPAFLLGAVFATLALAVITLAPSLRGKALDHTAAVS
jgi:MFS family permease